MPPISDAPAATRSTGARRRPAWIPTVAAFVTVAVFVQAGNWQRERMHEKEALLAQMQAASKRPPVPLPQGIADWHAWRYRTVVVTGVFDAAHQILIDNKVHAGHVGFGVVAPFRLDDGRAVLIDRGFAAAGASRAELPDPRPPQGTVTLRGRIDLPSAGYLELGELRAATGKLWQNIDPQRFAQETGIAVLPIVVEALDAPADDGLIRAVALPSTGIEKHLSYMLQWYTFAAMAVGLWLWFAVRPRLLRARRR
jgi:surfeit locus 1 family protein